MKDKKKKTLIYEAFGFPVKLINVTMKKIVGEWVIDVDFTALEKAVLRLLIHKPAPLSGAELKFIRKYLQLTTKEFGKLFDVSHVAILKWEKENANHPISADIYIRLYVIHQLNAKDKEFRSLFEETTPSKLTEAKKKKAIPLSINIDEEIQSA